MNVLIYDIQGSHFNNVKATVEHFLDHNATIFRDFFGFNINTDQNTLDYCIENNIDVVAVPFGSISKISFEILVENGIAVVIPNYYGNVNQAFPHYTSTIRIWGGVNNPEDVFTQRDGLDFFGEAENFTGDMRIAPSYITGKVTALVANLLNDGYDLWQARQILRQNCNSFTNWTVENGFGKLPETITIPEEIPDIHPTSVRPVIPTGTNLNQGLGVINYQSSDKNFSDSIEELESTESPVIFEGEAKEYNIDWRRDYGGDFTQSSFELNEYEHAEPPITPNVFFFQKTTTGFERRRIHVGRTSSGFDLVPESRKGDQVEYQVWLDGDLLIQLKNPINSDTVLLEPLNNPDFSLNESGNEYTFRFRLLNLYGESDWSEDVVILDGEEQESELFDFRDEPEPDPEPEPEPGPEPEPEPGPGPDPDPEPEPEPDDEPTKPTFVKADRTGVRILPISGTLAWFRTDINTGEETQIEAEFFSDDLPNSAHSYRFRVQNQIGELTSENSVTVRPQRTEKQRVLAIL